MKPSEALKAVFREFADSEVKEIKAPDGVKRTVADFKKGHGFISLSR